MDEQDRLMLRARSRIGQILRDKWRLDRVLGVGGMASVYAATHRNQRRGAVKILHPELSLEADLRERFLREGYVANHVDHPGAVAVLDDDVTEDGSVFLVMELLDGQTVDAISLTRPDERLELGEVLSMADDLLDVLAKAHDKGIVHRDIKPENLFLTTQDDLKVLDFGIARLREQAGSSTTTATGAAMGTPAFMPPEQASGLWDKVDARSDLWAVGATMFALLTGRHVHQGSTIQLLLAAAMTRPAPPIASLMPELPPGVAALIDRALRFEPVDRWPDARAMRRAVLDEKGRLDAPQKPRSLPPPAFDASAAAGEPARTSGASAAGSPGVTAGQGGEEAETAVSRNRTLAGPRAARARTGALIAGAALLLGVGWMALRILFAPGTGATISATASGTGPAPAIGSATDVGPGGLQSAPGPQQPIVTPDAPAADSSASAVPAPSAFSGEPRPPSVPASAPSARRTGGPPVAARPTVSAPPSVEPVAPAPRASTNIFEGRN